MKTNILKLIEQKGKEFSKGQKVISEYILDNYDKAAFMTAAKLGESVGVSQSTVVRFATELGFTGYPELQSELQTLIKNRLTSVQRIELSKDSLGEGDILTTVLSQDIDKIRATLEFTSSEEFEKAVELITQARVIYILGTRSATALASFMGYYFNLFFDNVKMVSTNSVGEMFERIINIDKSDVMIGISFPRYSKKTVNALKYGKSRGTKVVAITDCYSSPLTKEADSVLLARSDMASFVDSLVAPLSLINALIVAVSMKKKDEVHRTFTKLEKIWEEYNVYEKSGEI